MADPQTINVGLSVPSRGSNVGVWDVPVNGDFVALDGFQGGVQTLGITNANITLTVPANFTATPSAGPTQAQNAVLRLTGVQTGNVVITLPMPGYYIVENLCTGNIGWIVQLQGVTATQVISIDRGMCQHIYNDGANVRFVNLGAACQMEFWAGYSAIPAWVANCTVAPYLICDGSVYNFSTYPVLGARFGSAFGGNGVTTFAVPDLRGRVPLAYDGTGGRITSAQSGINGQQIGAAADVQSVTLSVQQIPAHSHGVTDPGHFHSSSEFFQPTGQATPGNGGFYGGQKTDSTSSAGTGITIQNAGGGGSHTNVQPAQVAGIWVIRAA